jgi:hypothetical protein
MYLTVSNVWHWQGEGPIYHLTLLLSWPSPSSPTKPILLFRSHYYYQTYTVRMWIMEVLSLLPVANTISLVWGAPSGNFLVGWDKILASKSPSNNNKNNISLLTKLCPLMFSCCCFVLFWLFYINLIFCDHFAFNDRFFVVLSFFPPFIGWGNKIWILIWGSGVIIIRLTLFFEYISNGFFKKAAIPVIYFYIADQNHLPLTIGLTILTNETFSLITLSN